ncbi:hypothetical protein SAMN05661096_02459 [Marivirga sericea]|uniref:DUF6922 domain-containing protein n=1 Tax=Marivirga sericea TaxID=1028 RepID=A0A1X7K992_9BACT|nr:hypothetical protein [Marivirga sericea]SMG37514.1 hypothetical protein SAMN05661096_02459 [Marivirga sericea]
MKSLLSKLSKHLFWDVEVEKINPDTHASFIIERVLKKGTLQDFNVLNQIFSSEQTISIVKNLKHLDPKTANFAHIYFDIPKNEMKCYTKNQSQVKHWIY